MFKGIFMVYAAALSLWFLQADYYGKVWSSVLPRIAARSHMGYNHK